MARTTPTKKRNDLTDTRPNPNGHIAETEPRKDTLETDFPIEVFAKPIADFIEEAALAFTVDPASVAAYVLGHLSGAIGAARVIELKPDWKEYPALWIGNVIGPGNLKTPVMAACGQPFEEWQSQKWAKYQETVQLYDAQYQDWHGDRKNNSRPTKPLYVQRLTDDTTIEALADVLNASPRGTLIAKDELTAWVRSLNEYKAKGSDRSKYLSMWSSKSFTVNRKDKEPIHVEHPFVAIIGGIQPDLVNELQDAQAREDGLLDRFLWVLPRTVDQHWTEARISESTKANYCSLVRQLLDLDRDPSANLAQREILEPKTVTFTAEAKQEWITAYDRHCIDAASWSLGARLRAPYKKLGGYAAKLALILQVVKYLCGEADSESIDADSVTKAWTLIQYFKNQLIAVYGDDEATGILTTTKDDKQLEALAEWLRKWTREKGTSEISFRMMTQYAPTAIRKRKTLIPLVIAMIDLGELEIVEDGLVKVVLAQNKRPVSNYELLNSKLPITLKINPGGEV